MYAFNMLIPHVNTVYIIFSIKVLYTVFECDTFMGWFHDHLSNDQITKFDMGHASVALGL